MIVSGECEKVMLKLKYYIMIYLFCFLNVCNLVNYYPQCISFNLMNLTACICNIQTENENNEESSQKRS